MRAPPTGDVSEREHVRYGGPDGLTLPQPPAWPNGRPTPPGPTIAATNRGQAARRRRAAPCGSGAGSRPDAAAAAVRRLPPLRPRLDRGTPFLFMPGASRRSAPSSISGCRPSPDFQRCSPAALRSRPTLAALAPARRHAVRHLAHCRSGLPFGHGAGEAGDLAGRNRNARRRDLDAPHRAGSRASSIWPMAACG